MAIFHGTSIPAAASGGLPTFAGATSSIRFSRDNSHYLERSSHSTSANGAYTTSSWVKRSKLGMTSNSVSNMRYVYRFGLEDHMGFQGDDSLNVEKRSSKHMNTERYCRDISNWMHIVVSSDGLGNANSFRLYVNGVEHDYNDGGSYDRTADSYSHSNVNFRIGAHENGGSVFDGLVSQFYFIDGQALGPEAFGEVNSDYGNWIPKEYAGSYNSNSFYLPFSNSATHKSINSVNQTHHDTAESKWGGSSIRMDGSSDFLELTNADSALFQPFEDTTSSWTFDAWVKFASYAGTQWYISHGTGTSDRWGFYHIGDGTTGHYTILSNGGGTQFNGSGTGNGGLIADNDWHHVMWIKKANEVGMYVDGTQVGYIQNTQTHTTGGQVYIGSKYNGTEAFNGWMDDIRVYKGNPFEASPNTGNTDTITVPTEAHTSDTNTLILVQSDHSDGSTDITDSAGVAGGLGNDASGNENHFTLNNITSHDQMMDCPSNNYAVINHLDGKKQNGDEFSEGNLSFRNTANANSSQSRATIPIAPNSGKYYWEIYRKDSPGENGHTYGLTGSDNSMPDSAMIGHTADINNGIGFYGYGTTHGSGALGGTLNYDALPSAVAQGDIIQIAYDSATGKAWVGRNGTWSGSGDPSTGANHWGQFTDFNRNISPSFQSHNNVHHIVNFGQEGTFAGNVSAGGNADVNGYGNFKYAVPTDHLALCSANLLEPTVKPAENFSATVRSGNNNQAVTGIGFQPDLVWNKTRNAAHWHQWHDSVRGPTAGMLNSNQQTPEDNGYQFDSFDSDGFTVDSGNLTGINASGYNYVTWAWKADGSGSSNSNGSITSTVSANTSAGFSIVSYTGNGISGATIGHGLSQTPDLVIVKDRDDNSVNDNWFITSSSLTNSTTYNITLADIYAETNAPAATSYGGGLALTNNSVLTPIAGSTDDRTSNESGDKYIAYCFHSVEGYSKIGTYHANYQTDGPFIYTGFRPAFLMTKSINNNGWWVLFDTARSPINPTDHLLAAHTDITEKGPGEDTYKLDIVSNGFKLREQDSYSNASGTKYIYIAFAEQPFKYTNAR